MKSSFIIHKSSRLFSLHFFVKEVVFADDLIRAIFLVPDWPKKFINFQGLPLKSLFSIKLLASFAYLKRKKYLFSFYWVDLYLCINKICNNFHTFIHSYQHRKFIINKAPKRSGSKPHFHIKIPHGNRGINSSMAYKMQRYLIKSIKITEVIASKPIG